MRKNGAIFLNPIHNLPIALYFANISSIVNNSDIIMFSHKINQDIFPEVKYSLRVRTPKFEADPNYDGPLIFTDNVVGTTVIWSTPPATQADLDKLSFAIYNYKNYQALAEAEK